MLGDEELLVPLGSAKPQRDATQWQCEAPSALLTPGLEPHGVLACRTTSHTQGGGHAVASGDDAGSLFFNVALALCCRSMNAPTVQRALCATAEIRHYDCSGPKKPRFFGEAQVFNVSTADPVQLVGSAAAAVFACHGDFAMDT